MQSKKQPDLLPPVEAVFQGEPLKPAPVGLRRRIEQRVRYVALQDKERRRFRESVAAGVAGIVAFGAVAGFAAWQLSPLGRMAASTPGARGQLDRLAVFMADSWMEIAGLTFCALLATTLLALLLARGPKAVSANLRHRG